MSNYISLTNVKTELPEITDTSKDTILTDLINGIEGIWENLTDRIWYSATYTEYHNIKKGGRYIFLRNYPIISITSIHNDSSREFDAASEIDSDDYGVDYDNGFITVDFDLEWGTRSVRVIYVAGYATIPEWLKRILVRQVAAWYKQGKDRHWAVLRHAQADGSSLTQYKTTGNFLEDFLWLANRNRREMSG